MLGLMDAFNLYIDTFVDKCYNTYASFDIIKLNRNPKLIDIFKVKTSFFFFIIVLLVRPIYGWSM